MQIIYKISYQCKYLQYMANTGYRLTFLSMYSVILQSHWGLNDVFTQMCLYVSVNIIDH